jgi:hypothetical protein
MKLRCLVLIGIIMAVCWAGFIFAQEKISVSHDMTAPFPKHQYCDWTDDYSNSALWTPVRVTYEDTSDICCNTSGSSIQGHPGNINVGGGTCNFAGENGNLGVYDGGADVRVYRSIGTTLNGINSWKAEFDFKPTAIWLQPGPYYVGHAIFALTAGTLNPINDNTLPDICCQPLSNQDGVMVMYTNETSLGSSSIGFYIMVKHGASWDQSTSFIRIPQPSGVTSPWYYFRLERFNENDYKLSVFTDPQRTIHVIDPVVPHHSSPFCFSSTLVPQNLNILQHSNVPQGSYNRMLGGSLDNTCILRVNKDPCCFPTQIVGPSEFCCGNQAVYSIAAITGTVATYDWEVGLPENCWSGQGTNSITINTAGLDSCPESIIVKVTVECNCKKTIYSRTVTIHPKANASCFELTQSSTGEVKVTPCPGPAGYTHQWKLYHGVPPCNTNAIQGQAIATSSSDTPFIINIPASDNTCYVLVHSMSGPCPAAAVKMHFLMGKGQKLVVKGTEEIKVDVKAFEEKKNEMFLK